MNQCVYVYREDEGLLPSPGPVLRISLGNACITFYRAIQIDRGLKLHMSYNVAFTTYYILDSGEVHILDFFYLFLILMYHLDWLVHC